jgi:hypothetical protein
MASALTKEKRQLALVWLVDSFTGLRSQCDHIHTGVNFSKVLATLSN